MSDFNWNEFGASALSAISAGLSGNDETTTTPAASVNAAAFDVNKALPMVLIGIGAIIVLKALKVF